MQYQLDFPINLKAEIRLPSSKSISNRALIISMLTQDGIAPSQLAQCDDTDVTIAALKSTTKEIDIMAAGTAMRFLTAYFASVAGEEKVITGTERMKNRPINILVDALKELGADINYVEKEGYPPLAIRGKQLIGGKIALDGSISSQFITALLLVAPTFQEGLTIQLVGDITSVPYINMTLNLMTKYGADAKWTDAKTIVVSPKEYTPIEYKIEPDWSAASYWFEMVALNPNAHIKLLNLNVDSLQGDYKGAQFFKKLGVLYRNEQDGILLYKGSNIASHFEANFKDIPDLAQTFVVCCALLGTTFKFTGLETLRIKETDRIDALIKEMRKLGFILKAEGNHTIYWDGKTTQQESQPIMDTYEDHRMAMSFAPAAIIYPELKINDPMVVTKSYPSFWKDLEKAGVKLLKI